MNEKDSKAPLADHFSAVATGYVAFRPRYPDELFDYLSGIVPRRQQAWDCGCGSGQATLELADRFVAVLATDVSGAQIAAAPRHPHVTYRTAPAQTSGLPAASTDLIAIAQALHWFDLDSFYAEVRRVLSPNGVIAAWSYGIMKLEQPDIDAPVQNYRTDTLNGYWPPERRHVENGYSELAFPFNEIVPPTFKMEVEWHLPQLLGYLRSWSAAGRFLAERGFDPVIDVAKIIAPLWGDPYSKRKISWPLTLRVGRLA
ncbi:MAG TPA: class I SAM-dependent methyltransferase [Rhodocyclaceae bacterium]|nr:class I SAM-dependent methyltransferase [Rhodocyclaceae bacterium]